MCPTRAEWSALPGKGMGRQEWAPSRPGSRVKDKIQIPVRTVVFSLSGYCIRYCGYQVLWLTAVRKGFRWGYVFPGPPGPGTVKSDVTCSQDLGFGDNESATPAAEAAAFHQTESSRELKDLCLSRS